VLAERLTEWAALAWAMPPAWEGASISHAIGGDGGAIGRILPGKGLLLKEDLKNLGINKPLPAVYEVLFCCSRTNGIVESGAITHAEPWLPVISATARI
jgi:hypothetical protein